MLSRIRSIPIGTRAIVVVVTLVVVITALSYAVFTRRYRASATGYLIDKAAAFTAVADEAKDHAVAMHRDGAFDQEGLLEDLKRTLSSGRPYDEAKIFNTIPVVAGWKAAEKAANREQIQFDVKAFDARNKRNLPKSGSFEENLLRKLRTQVESGGEDVAYSVDEQANSLHYMRAITLSANCMMCHGQPGNEYDTDGDGKDPIGFSMEGWQIGEMHGAFHVTTPLDPLDEQVAAFVWAGISWTVPVLVVVLGLFVWFFRAIISKPIRSMIDRIRVIQSTKDLTQRVDVHSHDEIGQIGGCFNDFIQTLQGVITEVSTSTQDVASAAAEIAATSEQTAEGMRQQHGQTAQVAAAIEQTAASVAEVSQMSTNASTNADDAGKQASDGGQAVTRTVDSMRSIEQVVNQAAAAITTLGERGEQIGNIIEVINDIAEQTNLLALNAAIEAARAGEHGRGFAVVADEVRNLAERTTQSTSEVTESIKSIQEETKKVVEQVGSGTEHVGDGVRLATEAGESLKTIVGGAEQVSSIIQSIAAATQEQAVAAQQITKSVEAIRNLTEESAEGSEQASQAATQLSRKSEELQNVVDQFQVRSAS
ncbi:MAG: hypothetical protein CMJ18_25555 [Phycisphaeraceae bacterium]|nr:hypothetical protein [Phycisphaeraceae bacterium]